MVIARKVWGGNRTWEGARTQQILVSVLRTCWQQGKDAFTRCVRLLRAPRTVILDIVPARAKPRHSRHRMPESLTFCGRTFGPGELELMRQTAQEFSALGVTEIARTVCELLEWTRPNGGLKNHECRQLLERLQAEGFLKLPEVRKLGGRGPRRADVSEACSRAGARRMRRQRVRASGVGLGGRASGEPPVARAGGTVSLSRMSRAVRRAPALLGAASGAGVGLSALDLAGLEDAGAGRRGSAGATSSGDATCNGS